MFEPPKNSLDLMEIAAVLDLGFKLSFWDNNEILSVVEEVQFLLGKGKLSELVIQKSNQILDKTPPHLIISHLQTYYFSKAEREDTAFILWIIWFLVCKQKLPEMMAFAYTKLITEKEMLVRIKKIILQITKKHGSENLKNQANIYS